MIKKFDFTDTENWLTEKKSPWPIIGNGTVEMCLRSVSIWDCSFFIGSPRKIVTMGGKMIKPWTEHFSSLFSLSFHDKEINIWMGNDGRSPMPVDPTVGCFVRWENNTPKAVLFFELIRPPQEEVREARARIMDQKMRMLIKNIQDCC